MTNGGRFSVNVLAFCIAHTGPGVLGDWEAGWQIRYACTWCMNPNCKMCFCSVLGTLLDRWVRDGWHTLKGNHIPIEVRPLWIGPATVSETTVGTMENRGLSMPPTNAWVSKTWLSYAHLDVTQ